MARLKIAESTELFGVSESHLRKFFDDPIVFYKKMRNAIADSEPGEWGHRETVAYVKAFLLKHPELIDKDPRPEARKDRPEYCLDEPLRVHMHPHPSCRMEWYEEDE